MKHRGEVIVKVVIVSNWLQISILSFFDQPVLL